MNTVTPTTAKAYFLTNATVRDKYGDTLFHPLSNVNIIEIYVEDGDSDNVVTINYNPEIRKKWATHWFPCFYRGLVEYTLDGESEPRTFAQYITYMPSILSSMNQNSETAMSVNATLRQQAGNNLIGSYSMVTSLPTSYGDWLNMQELEENDVVAYVYESGLNGFYMVEYADEVYTWTLQTSGINNYVSTKQYDTWELSVQAGFGNPAEITELTDAQYMLIWQELSSLSASIVANDEELVDLGDGTTPVGKVVADQNGDVIDTTYEKLANKKSAFQETPTDDAYPTEKLVKDTTDALDSRVTVNEEDIVILADAIAGEGIGDIMLKSIYDTDGDGGVDKTHLSSYLSLTTIDELWNFNDGTVQGWEACMPTSYEVSNVDNKLKNTTIQSRNSVVARRDSDINSIGIEKFYVECELFAGTDDLNSLWFFIYEDEYLSGKKIVYDSVISGCHTDGYVISPIYNTTYNFAGVFETTGEVDILFSSEGSWGTSIIGNYMTLDNVRLIKITNTEYEDMTAQQIYDASVGEVIDSKVDADDIYAQLALKELLSNKVITISSPTDDEYFSAKLTNDQLLLKAPQATTYSKTEVDAKVSALYRFKGSVATYADLAAKEATAVNGDVWNVTTDESTGNSGVNYAWTGSIWDNIGGVEALASATNDGLMSQEDFSKLLALPTNTALNLLFADKVDKVTGSSLIVDSELVDIKEDIVTLEHLVVMTHDTGGKFYADVDNFVLSLNRDLTLLFPNTLTNLTTPVEVSFDNKATYKYLKYDDTSNSVVVKHTQLLKTNVHYDNTEWFMKGAPLINETITHTQSIDSTKGTVAPVKGIPELTEGLGLTLNQLNEYGDKSSSLSTNNYFQQDGSGDLIAHSAYNASYSNYDIVSGNKYFVRIKMASTSVNILRNEIILIYSDASTDTSADSVLSSDSLSVYGTITSTSTLNANLLTRAGVGGTQLDNLTWEIIDITNTPISAYTAPQINGILNEYIEGPTDNINLSIKSVGVNGFNKHDITEGYYVNPANGELSVSAPSNASDYIGITGSHIYIKGTPTTIISGGKNSVSFYRLDKTWISYYAFLLTGESIAVPTGAVYCRFSVFPADLDTTIIVLGTVEPDYVAYNSQTLSFKKLNGDDLHNRSVGSTRDKVRKEQEDWVKDEFVKYHVLVADDITSVSTGLTNIDLVGVTKQLDNILYGNGVLSLENSQTQFITGFNPAAEPTDIVESEYNFTNRTNGTELLLIVPKGTYADLAAAKADLAGIETRYVLATPLLANEILEATGSLIQEPITTIIQSSNIGTSVAIQYNCSIGSQVQTHTKKIIYLQKEIDNINSSGVFAYLGTSTNTTCTSADTWYSIDGTFVNDVAKDFSVAAVVTPGIKYDGSKSQYFEIDYHATLSGDGTGITTHLGIKKNGVIITGSKMGTFLKVIAEEQALSGTCVVSLEQDDEIQLVIMADGAGDVISVVHYTTTIRQF